MSLRCETKKEADTCVQVYIHTTHSRSSMFGVKDARRSREDNCGNKIRPRRFGGSIARGVMQLGVGRFILQYNR